MTRNLIRIGAMIAGATLLAAVPTQAEGWFSKIFGSRASRAVPQPRYLFGERLPANPPQHIRGAIETSAAEYGIDPNLLAAVIYQESRFDERAVSRRGAMGLMQLMPRTAAYLGVTDPFDPQQNVRGGAKYLAEMFRTFGGDLELSLAAYNAGPTAVKKLGPTATAEAVHYVAAIKGFYAPSRPRPWTGGGGAAM